MSDAELHIRALLQAGDERSAAEATLTLYGSELLGYLMAVVKCDDDAREVFSRTSERVCKKLRDFRWSSSLRTWLYTIAKHETARFKQQGARERVRRVETDAASDLEARPRTQTTPWLKTENKRTLRSLRDVLPASDRELLVLRVDRGLDWLAIARVFLGEEASEAALRTESARLRKRFQLVRDGLRDAAESQGLLPSGPTR